MYVRRCCFLCIYLLFSSACNCYADELRRNDIVRQIIGYDIKKPTRAIEQNKLIFTNSVERCNGNGGYVYFFLKKLFLFLTFGPYLNYAYNKLTKRLSFYNNLDYIRNQKKIDEYNRNYVVRDFVSNFIEGKGYEDLSVDDINRIIKEKGKYLDNPTMRSLGVDEIGLSLILFDLIKGGGEPVENICEDLSHVSEKGLNNLLEVISYVQMNRENSFLDFFSPEVLLPIKYGIENYTFCDKDGNVKIDYPFPLPSGMEKYKISKSRQIIVIIANIVFSFLLLHLLRHCKYFYLFTSILSAIYFLLFQYEDKNLILLSVPLFLFLSFFNYSPDIIFEFYLLLVLLLAVFTIFHYIFTSEFFIYTFFAVFALTGFLEEMIIFLAMKIDGGDGISVKQYISNIFVIYEIIKSNDVFRRVFKNEFKDLDSVFGACDSLDDVRLSSISQHDMARNAMLEQSCKLISSRYLGKEGASIHMYMDSKHNFRTLVQMCKNDIVKMFVAARKISAYLSIFLFLKREGGVSSSVQK